MGHSRVNTRTVELLHRHVIFHQNTVKITKNTSF